MDPLFLSIMVGGNLLLGGVALVYTRRLRKSSQVHSEELEKRERELKRRVLELQVLRSLSERIGYSLDLRKILEVIIESLGGLVSFSTISYMMMETEGRITLTTRVAEGVSRKFLDHVKSQMLQSFSVMTSQTLQPSLVDETTSGTSLDDSFNLPLESFFNLPIEVGGKVVALINVSSPLKGLYGDEETAILYTILNQVSSHASKLSQVVENEKRKLSAMVASLADGIIMVDSAFNLIVANHAVADLLKIEKEDNFFAILSALGSKIDLKGAIEEATGKDKIIKLKEFEHLDKAIQIDVEPVKDRFGYLLGAVVVLHDVTVAKQLERLREDFTAMMVHELRTPLTTVSYSTNMLLSDWEKMEKGVIKESVTVIKSTGEQMLSLVNELLDVAKIEAGKFVVTKQSGSLDKLIEEKVELFKPLTIQKQLQLTYLKAPNIPSISFDPKRLGQVLNNLLSNSLKYTDRGQITVSSKIEGNMAVVSISDTGDGIKTEDLDKLFSKFEQLGKGKTGEKGGSGLGLVITKGIVEAHGGKIWATSAGEGKGTTFSFSIPVQ